MHTNSKLLFQKYAIEFFRPGLRVLEIGSGGFPSAYQLLYDALREASLEVFHSKLESLEVRQYRRHIPGWSLEWQLRSLHVAYRVLGWFGFLVKCAYDTATIGRKVSQPTQPVQSRAESNG